MMIHDYHISLRRCTPSLEEKAAPVMRTSGFAAEIGLGRDLVPHLGPRRRSEIGERSVRRLLRPIRDCVELGARIVREKSGCEQFALREPQKADVVPPSLEQREPDFLLPLERLREKRKVLSDELLLEIDGVRRDNGALPVAGGPAQRRYQVRERFPHAGPRLQQTHSAIVVEIRDYAGHLALALAVFVLRQHPGNRAGGAKILFDGVAIERSALTLVGGFLHRRQCGRVDDWNIPIRARDHDSLSCAIL